MIQLTLVLEWRGSKDGAAALLSWLLIFKTLLNLVVGGFVRHTHPGLSVLGGLSLLAVGGRHRVL